MEIRQLKDRLLETSALARRLYGLTLTLRNGNSDVSEWFLFNYEKLKYEIDLHKNGIVLDLGAFKGEFTQKIKLDNPHLTFWLYEPILEYFNITTNKFVDEKNITVHQYGVSADGRNFEMQVDGLRSRQQLDNSIMKIEVKSRSIQEIFNSVMEIELVKMNIEGMEFECLEQLVRSNSLIKARYLLIQFHNFEHEAKSRREALRKEFGKDFNNLFSFEWMWELWIRKEK
jgi:FkbM family methyltransferase